MSKQLYDSGDVIQAGTNALEVTAVAYVEDPESQEKSNFSYTVRLKSELDAERAAEAERQKAAEVAAAENEKLKPEQTSDPEPAGPVEEGTE